MKHFRTRSIAIEFYQQCTDHRCPEHLRYQLYRASSSIALNLAEGNGKPASRDRLKFFYIALGSLRESQTILQMTYVPEDSPLFLLSDKLGAHIFRLCKTLQADLEKRR